MLTSPVQISLVRGAFTSYGGFVVGLGAPSLESYARFRELALSDPSRLRAISVAVLLHGCVAAAFAIAAFVADRRFHRPFGWLYAALGTSALYVVLVLEIIAHHVQGEGGLGAMAWFFGMLIGMPSAVVSALLTTWWMVGKAGVSARVWSALCALAYIPLIAMHGLAHW